MKLNRQYDSFLIRYWRLDGDKKRVAIEHLQSGGTGRLPSLAAAIAWIEVRHDGRPPAHSGAAATMPESGSGLAQFGRGEDSGQRSRILR